MDFVFNIAKGRAAELYWRVKNSDPANSALLVVALAVANLEADTVLQDKDTLADILSGATDEATNSGYARNVLTAADLAALTPDDTNDRMDLDIPDQTWTAVQAGSNWGKLVIAYRPASASPDSAIIPMTAHDFTITPDGSNIVAQIDAAGFYRAA
ncbi:hypothetical protein Ppa06_58080 [Planomonospora parontospora subsp. parontospora]|uniref:Uncharacterized protein n=2 Tax=Planomonospora parontospora TaxID=58119 RepID=A0AA37F759_9ACTN|nr:hypothetical protein [Planomonospora parontospora]GGK90377.1 hypothetical protein GCM10010126_57230 [Planomonospora parontospora]GII12010.1 hypothetical protein Ppa06_58080 [Planomonospora parontospora subsp. parontospora]